MSISLNASLQCQIGFLLSIKLRILPAALLFIKLKNRVSEHQIAN